MGSVIGLELGMDVVAAIRKGIERLADLELVLVPTGHELRAADLRRAEVEVLVVGHDVSEPIRAAQRAFAAAPHLAVLLVADHRRYAEVRRALQFAPLVSENVRCVDVEDPQQLAGTLGEMIERARKRARHRSALASINTQLTQAKPAQPALEILGRILERAPVGVAVVDAGGRLTALNPFGARLLESTEHDAMGTALSTWLDAADAERWRTFIRGLSLETSTVETFVVQRHSQRTELEVTGAPITDRDGGTGHVLLLRDVTEYNQLVEGLRTAQQDAESANRSKDHFLAMLGHELRNPLAPIVTALQLIHMKGNDTRFEREHAIIERQVKHVVHLVDDLLDVSRIARGKVVLHQAPVELSEPVAAAVEQTAALFRSAGHQLEVQVPSQGLRVQGDSDRLSQVVSNLLTNAAKYTPSGGKISVHAESVGGEVVLRVRDNGSGISPELLPRVFDSFVQGERNIDRSEGGLGLGLAIVRSVVGLHGGSVSAHSVGPGRGSEFVVRLPALAAPAPSAPAVAAVAPAAPAPSRGPQDVARVLVVDDNFDAAEMLAVFLSEFGHEVRVAHDGASALEVVRGFVPDIAILDIGLPQMDGYELARRLRAQLAPRSVHLMALTGYGQSEDRRRTQEAGFQEHLVKPVDLSVLRALLAQVAARLAATPG